MSLPKKVKIATGESVLLRFPRKDDLEKLVKMYTTLSEKSLRFLRPYRFTKDEVKDMLDRVDFKNVFSIVAENEKGEIVAEARLIRHSNSSAEIGIIVHDDYQNKKLGQNMVREMIEIAKDSNIKKLIAFINEKNEAAIHIFKKFGFKTEKRLGPELYIMGRNEAAIKMALNV